MELFNRTLLIALAILSAAFWLVVTVASLFFSQGAFSALDTVANFLVENNSLYLRAMFAMLGGVFLLVSLLVIVLEFSPSPSRAQAIPLPQVAGGNALLSTTAIAESLHHWLGQLPEIGQIKPVVKARGQLLDVSLELGVALGANLSAKAEEVQKIVRERVEGNLGLQVGQVTIYYSSLLPAATP